MGVPSLLPTHAEPLSAPMTPAERVREEMRRLIPDAPSLKWAQARGVSEAPSIEALSAPKLEPSIVQPRTSAPIEPLPAEQPAAWTAKNGRRHYCSRCRGRIETHWYECFVYPLRAIGWIVGIAIALTAVLGGLSLLLPRLLAREPQERLLYLAPCILLAIFVCGYACAFLDCVLRAAMTGHSREVVSPGHDLGLVLKTGVCWLFCFLAGPVGIALVGFLFWLHSGDPAVVDWLILGELGVVTVGYWLLCLLSVVRSDRLVDANPERVGELLTMLGSRALVATLAGSAIVLSHGLLAIVGAQQLHHDPDNGWLLLALACFSGMFSATFLFRLLGVWCHLGEARR